MSRQLADGVDGRAAHYGSYWRSPAPAVRGFMSRWCLFGELMPDEGPRDGVLVGVWSRAQVRRQSPAPQAVWHVMVPSS